MNARLVTALTAALLAVTSFAGADAQTEATFKQTLLVSDQPGKAPNTDPDLLNPWGLSQAPGGEIWVSDNHTGLSTLYDPNTGTKNENLIVTIPQGSPTGTVFIPSGNGFTVSENGKSGESIFLFDSESGVITGWNPAVDRDNAVVAYDGSSHGSVFKGLAYDPVSNHIFATDFANNRVVIFDNQFHKLDGFTDRNLPRRYAPFNVAVLNGLLYVTFAKREKDGDDEVDGKGFGYVDVFTTDGVLVKTLVANGALNGPWGLVIAPANFGSFAGALLVGNFGDGRINAFDTTTGTRLGTLRKENGRDIRIEGLWSLDDTGNGAITFSAGPGAEEHGLLGLITPN